MVTGDGVGAQRRGGLRADRLRVLPALVGSNLFPSWRCLTSPPFGRLRWPVEVYGCGNDRIQPGESVYKSEAEGIEVMYE